MSWGRILRIRHESRDIGFTSAHLESEASFGTGWRLSVVSPSDLDLFRGRLLHSSGLSLSLFAADGGWYAGEAAVAYVSESVDSSPVVTLSGSGPLRRR